MLLVLSSIYFRRTSMSLPDGTVLPWSGTAITIASYETAIDCDNVTSLAVAVTYGCDVVTACLVT